MALIKAMAAFNALFHNLYGLDELLAGAFCCKVMHVLKVSQIMASNRSPHHKMTNSG